MKKSRFAEEKIIAILKESEVLAKKIKRIERRLLIPTFDVPD